MENESKIEEYGEKVTEYVEKKTKKITLKHLIVLVSILGIIVLFNQYQISKINGMIDSPSGSKLKISSLGDKSISEVNINDLKSTGHSIAALFPVEGVSTQEDAIAVIISTGTPEYGSELGVSFDDPVGSLNSLAGFYPTIKQDIKKNNPEVWQRYVNLATKPVGISCEFCCGLNAVSIKSDGELMCGCKHNPAMHALTLWLMKNTDYSDVEIVKEALKWKALWYPKDMVKLTLQVGGGDASTLDKLPGMVGGC